MKLEQPYRGLIGALLYPVIFAPDPLDSIDWTYRVIVEARGLDASPEDYVEAIRRGLASSEKLANILPQPHSEEVVRAYLTALEQKILNAGPSPPLS